MDSRLADNFSTTNKSKRAPRWACLCLSHLKPLTALSSVSHLSSSRGTHHQSLLLHPLPSPSFHWEFGSMEALSESRLEQEVLPNFKSPTTAKRSFTPDRLADLSSQLHGCSISNHSSLVSSASAISRATTPVLSLSLSQSSCSTGVTCGANSTLPRESPKSVEIMDTDKASNQNCFNSSLPALSVVIASPTIGSNSTVCIPTPSAILMEPAFRLDLDACVSQDAYYADRAASGIQSLQNKTNTSYETSFLDWDSDDNDDDNVFQPLSKVNALVKRSIADLRTSGRIRSNPASPQLEHRFSSTSLVQNSALSQHLDKLAQTCSKPCNQQRSSTWPPRRRKPPYNYSMRSEQKRTTIMGFELIHDMTVCHELLVDNNQSAVPSNTPKSFVDKVHLVNNQPEITGIQPTSSRWSHWTKRIKCS